MLEAAANIPVRTMRHTASPHVATFVQGVIRAAKDKEQLSFKEIADRFGLSTAWVHSQYHGTKALMPESAATVANVLYKDDPNPLLRLEQEAKRVTGDQTGRAPKDGDLGWIAGYLVGNGVPEMMANMIVNSLPRGSDLTLRERGDLALEKAKEMIAEIKQSGTAKPPVEISEARAAEGKARVKRANR